MCLFVLFGAANEITTLALRATMENGQDDKLTLLKEAHKPHTVSKQSQTLVEPQSDRFDEKVQTPSPIWSNFELMRPRKLILNLGTTLVRTLSHRGLVRLDPPWVQKVESF